MKLIQELAKSGLNVRLLNGSDKIELQEFIELFDDFFILCEGEKGSAEKVLIDCPPSKNPLQDKLVLGVHENEQLICVIDLIQNYPDEDTWTIGYLLIHPNYRSQGKGYYVVENLASALSQVQGKKMRCGVQEQNPRALNFWTKCEFNVGKTIQENLGPLKNNTYVLERRL
jgi:ribosomal protein S18 acetylase RimI-like enzyme